MKQVGANTVPTSGPMPWWSEVAQVKATSVIDTIAVNNIIQKDNQRLVPVGGIAFAGDRGISKVEVRVDGGPWELAQLRAPLSETTWVSGAMTGPSRKGNTPSRCDAPKLTVRRRLRRNRAIARWRQRHPQPKDRSVNSQPQLSFRRNFTQFFGL